MRTPIRVRTHGGTAARVLAPLCLLLGLALVPLPRAAESASPHRVVSPKTQVVGRVHAIKRGLTVQPPHRPPGRGKVRQSLYNQYGLHTKRQEKASVAFRDGTLLHMNQLTDVVLRSSSMTYVSRGEVDQISIPGSNHRVQTAAAVASAIGTQFDLHVRGKTTTIAVVEGAVLVKNAMGSVVVKTNQQTTVVKGQPPHAPAPVDAAAQTSWTNALPPPDRPLGENAALDANGGGVVAYSSQRSSPDARWDARNVDDGRLDRGWATASGQTANQWVILAFGGNKTYALSSVLIDPAATGGLPADTDLRTFTLRVSTTGTDDAAFSTVLTGTLQQRNTLQRFDLPHPVDARYMELLENSNYGSTDGTSVAELALVTGAQVDVTAPTPVPIATPTPPATATATATATPPAAAVQIAGVTVYAADGPPDPNTCVAPGEHATTTIRSTDPIAVVKVTFGQVTGSHTESVSFNDPSGKVAFQGNPAPLTSNAAVCHWLSVGGWPPTSIPGTWTIHIMVDGADVATTTYTLVHAPDAITFTGAAMYREFQPAPSSGNVCDRPGEIQSSSILPSDQFAEAKFTFSVWQGAHTLHGEFHDPTGAIYFQNTFTETDQGGSEWCFWIQVAGASAASMPGSWIFDLSVDGQPTASVPFTIQPTGRQSYAAGGAFLQPLHIKDSDTSAVELDHALVGEGVKMLVDAFAGRAQHVGQLLLGDAEGAGGHGFSGLDHALPRQPQEASGQAAAHIE